MTKSKYKTLLEWKVADPKAYTAAKSKGLLIKICELFGWDLPTIRGENGKYDKASILKLAQEYSGDSFRSDYKNEYNYAAKENFVNELSKIFHNKKKNSILTKALNFSGKNFQIENRKDYSYARHNGFLDDLANTLITNRINRYKEETRKIALAYTGTRFKKEFGARSTHALKNGYNDELNKWLNRVVKTKDIKEKWLSVAKEYKGSNFKKDNPSAYDHAKVHKYLDELNQILGIKSIKKIKAKYTFEDCLNSALNYSSPTQWAKNCSTYDTARRNGWLEACCKHMLTIRITWTKDLCIQEAKKHHNKEAWKKASPASQQAARKKGWMDDCCKHMIKNDYGTIRI
jgi:hypothetical protein